MKKGGGGWEGPKVLTYAPQIPAQRRQFSVPAAAACSYMLKIAAEALSPVRSFGKAAQEEALTLLLL